jgi:hypothetical protein
MSENKFDDLMRQKLQTDEGADIPFDGAAWDKLAAALPPAQKPFWQRIPWKWGLFVCLIFLLLGQAWYTQQLADALSTQEKELSLLSQKIDSQEFSKKQSFSRVDTLYIVLGTDGQAQAEYQDRASALSFLEHRRASGTKYRAETNPAHHSNFQSSKNFSTTRGSSKALFSSSTTPISAASTAAVAEEEASKKTVPLQVETKESIMLTNSFTPALYAQLSFALPNKMISPSAGISLLPDNLKLQEKNNSEVKKLKKAQFSELLKGVSFSAGGGFSYSEAEAQHWGGEAYLSQGGLSISAELSPYFSLESGLTFLEYSLEIDDVYEDYDAASLARLPGPLRLRGELPEYAEVKQRQLLVPLSLSFSPLKKFRIRPYFKAGVSGGWQLSQEYTYVYEIETPDDDEEYLRQSLRPKHDSRFKWRWVEASIGLRAAWGKSRRLQTRLGVSGFTHLEPSGYDRHRLAGYRFGAQFAWRLR